MTARGHEIENGAEGEDVRAPIELVSFHLLRRHVRRLALDLPGVRVGRAAAHRFRDAEVHDLHDAVEGHEDVLRRRIAVDERKKIARFVAQLVRSVQTGRRLADDANGDGQRDAAGLAARRLENRAEGFAVDPIHHEEERAGLFAEVEDLRDIRVADS